ncbi:MAG: ABC transporter ATP-binding protein [Planctomycetota bacterium]|jgi:ABC-type sugar transport system ATPase subunit
MPAVEARQLTKTYAGRIVLDLESWSVEEGEKFVLVGPNGSGKSTCLRILAGLVEPDRGTLLLDGSDVAGVPPHERPIGFVFQSLALWPHLSVRGNIALGLDRVVPDATERRRRIDEAAAELGIDRFLDRRPAQLSGGERQRVALARALVRHPKLLLLDEPFSDLDARLRRSTARLVNRLHEKLGMTIVLITHDRTDAYLLGDRIGVLRDGRMVACGTPGELVSDPGSAFAAEFFSDASLVPAFAAGEFAESALGPVPLRSSAEGAVLVAVRPDEVTVGKGALTGTVVGCEFAGGPWQLRVAIGETVVAANHETAIPLGEEVALTPPASARAVVKEDR